MTDCNAKCASSKPRLTEALPWKRVAGEDLYYPTQTDSSISFLRVVEANAVLTYPWASDDGVACGVMWVRAAG